MKLNFLNRYFRDDPVNSAELAFLQNTPFHDLIAVLMAALGCGLLIGLERERSKQRENQHSFAGLRSFTACALLGAVCFLFGAAVGLEANAFLFEQF
jgi:uncharacterized membrane protein YhiD involved in acid resistance